MPQILAWLTATAAAQPFLSVPSSVTSNNASAVVDPDFAGFAFEEASLWNYALDADGNANEFSLNLIAAITNRTGGKPLIRLGGTSYASLVPGLISILGSQTLTAYNSADYAYYLENQTDPALPRAEVYNYRPYL